MTFAQNKGCVSHNSHPILWRFYFKAAVPIAALWMRLVVRLVLLLTMVSFVFFVASRMNFPLCDALLEMFSANRV